MTLLEIWEILSHWIARQVKSFLILTRWKLIKEGRNKGTVDSLLSRLPFSESPALTDKEMQRAICNVVLRAHAQNTCKTHIYCKGQWARALKNLDPTALPVAYKNQKNIIMDSEIFQGRFFRWLFVLSDIFCNRTPVCYVYVGWSRLERRSK